MFTSEQYRAKALEYGNLVETSLNDNEKRKYQKLQQRLAALADNEDWLADHYKQTLHAADTEYLSKEQPITQSEHSDNVRLAQEEEHVLRCLGAALIMQWGTLPRKLQRELFDNAGAMGDLLDTASLRGQIARFLHKSNSDCTSDDRSKVASRDGQCYAIAVSRWDNEGGATEEGRPRLVATGGRRREVGSHIREGA